MAAASLQRWTKTKSEMEILTIITIAAVNLGCFVSAYLLGRETGFRQGYYEATRYFIDIIRNYEKNADEV